MKSPVVPHFSDVEIQGLRSVFNQIDADHSGLLDKKELYQFLVQSNMDTRFIGATFRVFDTDQDGTLSFDEFLQYLHACLETEKNPHYLFKMIFDAVDTDNNGYLSIDELLDFTSLCGQNLTREQVSEELNKIDLDKNGLVDFYELCQAFHI